LKAFQKIREDLISRIWVKIRENLSPRKFVHLKDLKKQPNDENISITVKPSPKYINPMSQTFNTKQKLI